MKVQQALALGLVPFTFARETVVGVYMFHRHGDRTPKILPPANLTTLGYSQVYSSGTYYRNRYIASDATTPIWGISSDQVNELQIAASAPLDPVLQNSAQGFLQALYPSIGATTDSPPLANGKVVKTPLDGYQLIPVNLVESGSGSEDSGWLQDATGCFNAETSSNDYFYSPEYTNLLSSTKSLYHNLLPVISGVFDSSTATFQNAYTIWDYLNVGEIHNQTGIVSDDVFDRLHVLANTHEYNLAYNSSSEIRAIAGMQLGAEIVDFLDATITSKGENKIGIQFGSYGTFFSFFGLAQLPKADPAFYGITNYASAMTFELFTTQDFTDFPSADQLQVRFYFHNGTTSENSPPQMYPLFGQPKTTLSWSDFKMNMGKFSIGSTPAWCHACGNTTGQCLPFSGGAGASGTTALSSGGMSNAVAGVIGAMVTLVVILLIEALILIFGGLTIVRKNRLLAGKSVANGGNGAYKA